MITAAFLGITGALIGKNMFREGLYKAFLRNAEKFSGSTKKTYVSEINKINKNVSNMFDTLKYKSNIKVDSHIVKQLRKANQEFVRSRNEANKFFYNTINSANNDKIFKTNKELKTKLINNYKSNAVLDNNMTKKEKKDLQNIIQQIKSNKDYKNMNNGRLAKRKEAYMQEKAMVKNVSDMISAARVANITFDGTAIGLTGVMGLNMKKEGINV